MGLIPSETRVREMKKGIPFEIPFPIFIRLLIISICKHLICKDHQQLHRYKLLVHSLMFPIQHQF